jgi:hypothetical protein
MTVKEKVLVLWVFAMVMVAFAVSHVASHAAFVLQNWLAVILPMLKS